MHSFYLSQYTGDADDDARIARCLRDSAAESPRTIVFDEPYYTVSRAILLPPDTTVILDGCRIVQADDTVDNVFRGDNVIPDPANPLGMPLACGKTRNIRIIGRNGARISGPAHNARAFHPVMNEMQDIVGDFWGWRTFTVCLSNCDGFEVSGIAFDRSRCWTLSFDRCINGQITDIALDTHCKNGDGIDLRSGCHHCVIRQIRGTTADDTVACTALASASAKHYPDGNYLYPMAPSACVPVQSQAELDISDIAIEDICTNGCHHGVICLAANGNRVSDIRIDGVTESAPGDGHAREALVKIYTGYGKACAVGDLHDISVRNVVASYAQSALYANTRLVRCTLQNIHHRNHGDAIRLDDPAGTEIIDAIPAQDVQAMLTSLGIAPNDCVAMHIALKSIGKLDGGAEGLLDALTGYLRDGLLVIPTHTWATIDRAQPVFDVRRSVPCIGAFPTVCAQAAFERPNAVRSLHPTHSAAVFGRWCAEFAAGEEKTHSRTPRNGLWGRLYDENAKILLVGVGLERNTYMHSIDEEVNGLPDDPAKYFDAQVIDASGAVIDVPHMNTDAYWPSSDFPMLEPMLRDAGALTFSHLGAARVMCFDVRKGRDALLRLCADADDTRQIAGLLPKADAR